MTIAAASGPDWASIMTAFGTVAAALAAVGIAAWSHWQSVKRIDEEQQREQLTEAYAVRVVQGERPAKGQPDSNPSALVLVAIVRNGGHYTVTRIEVRFSYDGSSLVSPRSNVRVSSFPDLPDRLREQGDTSQERAMHGVLTPWDTGMRSESDEVGVQHLKGHYALVRWTDQWGQRWEHRLGEVREVRNDENWTP